MERTRFKTFWRTSDFILNHKFVSAILVAILVVAVTGGVAFGSVGMFTNDDTTDSIDGSELIPIQQGTSKKVNFMPAYYGDTPPCNFYKKEADGIYTQITNITNMNSLANKIRDARPENVYTDGQGVTFYGAYDTKWGDAFYTDSRGGGKPQYDFMPAFKRNLVDRCLPITHVYADGSKNWDVSDEASRDIHCWQAPKIGDVSYDDFYNAYKLGDSTYKGGDPNLLSPNVYRTWGSYFHGDFIYSNYTFAYKCETPGKDSNKWAKSILEGDDTSIGAVILTQKMQNFTVTFNGNGHGSNLPQSQTVLDCRKVSWPSVVPKEPGFDFGGWYKEAECLNAWDFNRDIVSSDTILYAKWYPELDPSTLIPIQQGTTTKVNFLPAYYGSAPPCRFYQKDIDGTFTLIVGITDMSALANKIREIRPENVYAEGLGATFYGTYDTLWRDAFDQFERPDLDYAEKYGISKKCANDLIAQNLPITHVYGDKTWNWDTHCWDTPKLGNVSYEDFYNAYKLGDSTYKGGDPNLLSSNVYRTWGSYFRNPIVGSKYTFAYKCENSGSSYDKWTRSYTNYDSSSRGAIILAQQMTNHTVTFLGNGHGTNLPQTQSILDYHKLVEPSMIPTESGYVFGGWFTEPECLDAWDFTNNTVKMNSKLYAKWVSNSELNKLIPIQQGTSYKVNFLPAYSGDTPPCNFYKKESDSTYSAITGITNMDSLALKIRDIGADKVYADPKGVTFYGFYDNTTWSNAFKHENDGNKHHRYEFLDSFKTELTNHGLPTTSVYTDRAGSDYVNPGNWDYHNADTPTLNGISIHTFWRAYKNINVNLLGTNSWRIWTSYEDTFASDDAMEYWDSDGKMEWHTNKDFEENKGSVILTKTF